MANERQDGERSRTVPPADATEPSARPQMLDRPAALGKPEVVEAYVSRRTFVGTDLEHFGSAKTPGTMFGPRRDAANTMHLTVAVGTAPVHRQRGTVQANPDGSGDPNTHMTLRGVARPMTQEAFAAEVGEEASRRRTRQALVYFHGTQTGLAESVLRTTALQQDIGEEAVWFACVWPSGSDRPQPFAFTTAMEESRISASTCAAFLALVLTHPAFDRVGVIAFSRGADLAGSSVVDAHRIAEHRAPSRPADRKGARKVSDLALVAAETSEAGFRDRVLPRLRAAGTRIAIYGNEGDRVLQSAGRTKGSRPIGLGGAGMFKAEGVDSIDVRGGSIGNFGHDLLGIDVVLRDLSAWLIHRLPPDHGLRQRELRRVPDEHGRPYHVLTVRP